MGIRSVHRKTDRTPEEQAELAATRARFQHERPTQGALLATGEYDGPYRHADVMALLSALATMKEERTRRGLTLDEVSARSGMDRAMISRLETGKILNPTMSTLWRYAEAIGMKVSLTTEPAGCA